MQTGTGRRRMLPRSRRLVCDLLHFARQVPLFALERSCDLGKVAEARAGAPRRIAWSMLFLKAYAMLARDDALRRQAYLRWPWPHLYEHPASVAMLAIHRGKGESERLYWGRFKHPESQPLTELQARLDRYKTEPVEAVFRSQQLLSRLPGPVRRLAWWLGLNVSGDLRARQLGTCGLWTRAGQGAVHRYHPTCLTTSLTYGPMGGTGHSLVTILYDPRVADSACIARALSDLEALLKGPITRELEGMAGPRCRQSLARGSRSLPSKNPKRDPARDR
jgi:hypothetical protein